MRISDASGLNAATEGDGVQWSRMRAIAPYMREFVHARHLLYWEGDHHTNVTIHKINTASQYAKMGT